MVDLIDYSPGSSPFFREVNRNALATAGYLLRKSRAQPARQPDPEHDRQAADLVLERDPLADQLIARKDQRPDGMGWQRLHVDGFEETGTRQLRQPAGIVGIGLVRRQRLQRQMTCRLSMQITGTPRASRPW